jgi:hypothetical protein
MTKGLGSFALSKNKYGRLKAKDSTSGLFILDSTLDTWRL